jgi:hypothetical protein
MHNKNGEYTNRLYTYGALAQSFQSLNQTVSVSRPFITRSLTAGRQMSFWTRNLSNPLVGKRRSTVQLSAIKGCHHILIYPLAMPYVALRWVGMTYEWKDKD